MSNKLRSLKHSNGFTIIEVIIVLVIAAVIMLAVFLVVPQLQRSSRNARQQDNARRTLTAIQQYVTNNQNSFPTAANLPSAITNITGDMKSPVTNCVIGVAGCETVGLGTVGTAPSLTPGSLYIYSGGKCSGSTNTTPATNAYAAIVGTEPSGTGFCTDIQ